uniref:Uncharacterized protein n=1 Tax=viral metagenome TaxID=1070528 RepID=A0A6C0J609_9ZZZZ
MKELYPDQMWMEFALIQNVYTSHYTNASIYHGYYVHIGQYDIDILSDSLYQYKSDIEGLEFIETGGGHNIKHESNLSFFIGIKIIDLVETEDMDDCHLLAKQLSSVYNIPQGFPTKEALQKELLSKYKTKELTVIGKCRTITWQNMCYCCT